VKEAKVVREVDEAKEVKESQAVAAWGWNLKLEERCRLNLLLYFLYVLDLAHLPRGPK
jgi:hypothetical protein